ncbi:McrC family protein [Actinoplanes solisilvae]|uniref:McrC family protein n=1 Tax=Actinoplanes solisilvae TaxID=2486853 RepID=UPI000FDA89C3|nr:hypothetical protein [Actinoplanes solisilvae]
MVEYATITVELEPAEAVELSRLSRGTRSGDGRPRVIERVAPATAPGSYEVTPGPYVGRFRLSSGRVVDIGSRFPFADMAVLLELGHRATLLHDDIAVAAGGHGLMDVIATAFCREAARVTGQGLAKAYEQRTFLRPPYPGAPSVSAQLRVHAGRPDRLATRASRLTVNVPLNQVVATALRRLLTLTYSDKSLTQRLRALAPAFQRVTEVAGRPPETREVPARYRDIVPLARLILEGQTALPVSDECAGASVLFSMTKIWEAYVGRWLSARWPGSTISGQHRITLTDSSPDRAGWADFVVLEADVPVAVYDAKYRPWRAGPSTDEIYQLYTYARRLGITHAALVYPAAEERHASTTVDEVTIESYGVPVRQVNSGS